MADLEEQKKYFSTQNGYYRKYGIFQINEKIQKCEKKYELLFIYLYIIIIIIITIIYFLFLLFYFLLKLNFLI